MIVLIIISFLAGVVTILSPCILPILPVILSGGVTGDRIKPIGIISGFIFSFTFFTLFLTSLVNLTGISSQSIRYLSVFILLMVGISMLIPQVDTYLKKIFNKLASRTATSKKRQGFFGGLLLGVSIGIVWTPCVGPIMASVISLALTGSVSGGAIIITLFYALGTAIPMLLISYSGQTLLKKVPYLVQNTKNIQRVFGVIILLTAVMIYFNFERKFQTFILEKFPKYGTGLTKIEEIDIVKDKLDLLDEKKSNNKKIIDLFDSREKAPNFRPDGKWFNGNQVNIEDLKGNVVLVDFWTYTCINCIRTLPYLKSWHDKYQDEGLVIVGVHTPEFEFEKNADNLQEAIEDFSLEYLIFQDNEYRTWRAYENKYWPAKYLIDKDGYVRYTHFGEGAYDETEKKIVELLREIGIEISSNNIDNPDYQTYSRTPELYLGYERQQYLSTDNDYELQEASFFNFSELDKHHFGFQGEWIIDDQYVSPAASSKLRLNFEAREVFLVMRSRIDVPGKVKVGIFDNEGIALNNSYGSDVFNSQVNVISDRLYHLVSLDKAGNYILELEFLDDNLELFAFTFG